LKIYPFILEVRRVEGKNLPKMGDPKPIKMSRQRLLTLDAKK
jgi:hypothetical protein